MTRLAERAPIERGTDPAQSVDLEVLALLSSPIPVTRPASAKVAQPSSPSDPDLVRLTPHVVCHSCQSEHQPIDQHPTSLVIATSGLCLRLPWRRPRLRRENYVADT